VGTRRVLLPRGGGSWSNTGSVKMAEMRAYSPTLRQRMIDATAAALEKAGYSSSSARASAERASQVFGGIFDLQEGGMTAQEGAQELSQGNIGRGLLDVSLGTLQAAAGAAPFLARPVSAAVKATRGPTKAQQAQQLLETSEATAPQAIMEATERGGYSVNLPTGSLPSEGLMMGKYSNIDPRNVVLGPHQPISENVIQSFVQKNLPALQRQENYLGTWRDPETGKTYMDVSRRFSPTEVRQATKFGERTGQLAGYNVGKGESFPVGNWENFVNSPEFFDRMREMEKVGRDYLNKHASKEWWDMHGSSFERVYGPESLTQLAGFIASTAPMSKPRENLQTMSEYMRRFIKQEPIVQPDWRVPAGQMTRKEGTQIGNETGRAANLRKSEKGQLNDLLQDKVREEAMALMGDQSAVVLDRHWARLAEDPVRGIFTAAQEGIIEPGKAYQILKSSVTKAAQEAGRSPRDFSADVWTGIRETIKNKSELFGQKYKGSAIGGESKSYADQFDDLISDKAKFLGITVKEMEDRLRRGDATLLSVMLFTPIGAAAYSEYQNQQRGEIGL